MAATCGMRGTTDGTGKQLSGHSNGASAKEKVLSGVPQSLLREEKQRRNFPTTLPRAYQVYLSDQPSDLVWLTAKDGKLKEIEFKAQPGQQGGLEVERIK